jgi:hypothetical protein
MRLKRLKGGMKVMRKGLFLILLFGFLWGYHFQVQAAEGPQGKNMAGHPVSGSEKSAVFAVMPGPGKKVPLPDGYYATYSFDKKPKLGMLIVKVEIFSQDGKRDTSFEIKGDSGMPSMKGHHDTGEQPFQLSKKGDYLLPVNIVMPGDWEIRLTFLKNGKVQFRGSYPFDV